MLKQTSYLDGSKVIQFADKSYTLGKITVDHLLLENEIMDAESFAEFMNFFIKRDERTSYFCDNCVDIGIIRNPNQTNLSTFVFKNRFSDEMFLYVLVDEETNTEIIIYLSQMLCTLSDEDPKVYIL